MKLNEENSNLNQTALAHLIHTKVLYLRHFKPFRKNVYASSLEEAGWLTDVIKNSEYQVCGIEQQQHNKIKVQSLILIYFTVMAILFRHLSSSIILCKDVLTF